MNYDLIYFWSTAQLQSPMIIWDDHSSLRFLYIFINLVKIYSYNCWSNFISTEQLDVSQRLLSPHLSKKMTENTFYFLTLFQMYYHNFTMHAYTTIKMAMRIVNMLLNRGKLSMMTLLSWQLSLINCFFFTFVKK